MSCQIASQFAPSRISSINRDESELSARGYLRYFSSEYYRVGAEELYRIKATISERDKLILSGVFELKVLSTKQIQRLFFSYGDHNSILGAERICYRVLARLTKDKLIQRSNRKIGGLGGGSSTYVYRLGAVGARLLETKNRTYDLNTISTLFLSHTLEINEIYVGLTELHSSGVIKLVSIETEPYCWRQFTHNYGARDILKPDMFARLINPNTGREYFRFIELDRATSHPSSIAKKAKVYEKYFYSGNEQTKNEIFPGVLWVVPDEERKKRLKSVLKTSNKVVKGLHNVIINDNAISVISGDNYEK